MAPAAERPPPASRSGLRSGSSLRSGSRLEGLGTLPQHTVNCQTDLLLGHLQRRLALLVAQRHVCARPEQAECTTAGWWLQWAAFISAVRPLPSLVLTSAPDGAHQRGDTGHVPLLDARPVAQQLLDDSAAAAVRSHE